MMNRNYNNRNWSSERKNDHSWNRNYKNNSFNQNRSSQRTNDHYNRPSERRNDNYYRSPERRNDHYNRSPEWKHDHYNHPPERRNDHYNRSPERKNDSFFNRSLPPSDNKHSGSFHSNRPSQSLDNINRSSNFNRPLYSPDDKNGHSSNRPSSHDRTEYSSTTSRSESFVDSVSYKRKVTILDRDETETKKPKTEPTSSRMERSEVFGFEWERKEQRERFRKAQNSKTTSAKGSNLIVTLTNISECERKPIGNETIPNVTQTISNVTNDQSVSSPNDSKTTQPISTPPPPRTGDIKMVIVPNFYPKTTLTSEQIVLLREYLFTELNRGDRRKIQIKNCHPFKGSLCVVCVDEKSCEWLKSVVDHCFIWKWLNLTVKDYDELHGTIRMTCTVPIITTDSSEIIRKISKCNFINTDQWKIVNQREQYSANTISLIVIIDKLSYKKLCEYDFKLKYDLNTIVFHKK